MNIRIYEKRYNSKEAEKQTAHMTEGLDVKVITNPFEEECWIDITNSHKVNILGNQTLVIEGKNNVEYIYNAEDQRIEIYD